MLVEAQGPHDEGDGPDGGPHPRHAGLHVDAEAEHADDDQDESPRPDGQHAKAVGRQHQGSGSAEGGDTDPGGEELEGGEQHADQKEQVGDRRAGRGVQELLDEAQLLEISVHRRAPAKLAVRALVDLGGVQRRAIDGLAVQADDEIAQGRGADGGDLAGEGRGRPDGPPGQGVGSTREQAAGRCRPGSPAPPLEAARPGRWRRRHRRPGCHSARPRWRRGPSTWRPSTPGSSGCSVTAPRRCCSAG